MGILAPLIMAVLHLIMIALDLQMFFLLIYIVASRWRKPILLAFKRLGEPLVDPMLSVLWRALPGKAGTNGRWGRMIAAVILLGVVEMARFVVALIAFQVR
ncbi:MAG: hypothetical protein HY287_15095 [Planctomycetes bacterium]|nr:hypothetical protein [Planctomycetota bacterium]